MSETANKLTLKNAPAYVDGATVVFETIELLGIEVSVRTPATVETYDLAAARENACLNSANSNHGYRGFATAARSKFAEKLSATYPDLVKGKDETAAKYVERVRKEKGEAEVNTYLATAIDPDLFLWTLENARERSGPNFTKELSKQLEGLRMKWESGTSTPENTAIQFAKLGVTWPNPSKDVDDSVILPLLRDYKKELERQAASSL